MNRIELTDDQRAASIELRTFRDGYQLAGYAGTGKTTIIADAVEHDPSIVLAAPTNRAAKVLQSKLPPNAPIVRTFHTLALRPSVDEDGTLLGFLPGSRLAPGTRVVIDEASMVGWNTYRIANPVLAGCHVALVGDGYQLPPVNDDPLFGPDFDRELTQVHRQAEGSAALELATRIRTERHFDEGWVDELGIPRSDRATIVADEHERALLLTGQAVYLCWTNVERANTLRALRRKHFGVKNAPPCVGERILLMQREQDTRGFAPRWHNGDEGVITSAAPSHWYQGEWECRLQIGDYEVTMNLHQQALEHPMPRAKIMDAESESIMASYAYARTAHKAQGSEWPRVYLNASTRPGSEDGLRWLYTAITRTSGELVWVS